MRRFRLVITSLLAAALFSHGRAQRQDILLWLDEPNENVRSLLINLGGQLPLHKLVAVALLDSSTNSLSYTLTFTATDNSRLPWFLRDTIRYYPSTRASCCFVDLNFDGYLDARLEKDSGVRGERVFCNWLFDPTQLAFVRNTSYDGIIDDIELDSTAKTISFSGGSGFNPRTFSTSTYKILNDNAVLYQVEATEEWKEDTKLHWKTTVTKWIDGNPQVDVSEGQEEDE